MTCGQAKRRRTAKFLDNPPFFDYNVIKSK